MYKKQLSEGTKKHLKAGTGEASEIISLLGKVRGAVLFISSLFRSSVSFSSLGVFLEHSLTDPLNHLQCCAVQVSVQCFTGCSGCLLYTHNSPQSAGVTTPV